MQLVTIVTKKQDGPIDPRPEFQGGLNWFEERVIRNRERILAPYGLTDNFVRMSPNHEDEIAVVDEESLERWRGKLLAGRPEVDALVTNLPNIGLECLPADCGVYAIFHEELGWLGMAHAGREGSIVKVLEKTIRRMAELSGTKMEIFIKGLKIWMAPAICGKHYLKEYIEIPKKDLEEWKPFILGEKEIVDAGENYKIKAKDKSIGIDFVGFNCQQLLNCGLKSEQLDLSEVCTFESEDYFSSYRDKIAEVVQGRFMVMVMMKP